VGGAAVGAARLASSRRARRPRLLGIPIPDELMPQNLDPKRLPKPGHAKKLAKGVDVKALVKRIGDAAEQVEARSEDVRMLSAQAKRLSRKLS
jgi:hypothetical protein